MRPQAAPLAQKRPTGLLSRVVKGRVERPDRVLLYGVEGIGKSSWAAKANAPIFVCPEDGTNKLDVARFPSEDTSTYQGVLAAIDALTNESHDYQTIVLDTLDWLEQLVWSAVCARDKKQTIEDYGYGKGYVTALNEWRVLVSKLERLRAAKSMDVILLAHAQIRTFKNPEGDDFDRYELKLHAKAAGFLREWCENVLFAHYETFVDTKEKGGKSKSVGISTGARVVGTTRTAAWDAKNRDGLPESLPLDYADYATAKKAGRPDSPERLRASIAASLEELDDAELTAKVKDAVEKAKDDAVELASIKNRLDARRIEKAAKGE
jgi:hypothetical protein